MAHSSKLKTKPLTLWGQYLELCKPRVVLLMLITAYVGMALAVPGAVPWQPLICGLLGIGLLASAAATVNHLIDRRIDSIMQRTKFRPIATGTISPRNAIIFASVLGTLGFIILITTVNWLTAILTLLTLVGYAVIYTMFLKRATPQNIVIGGLAGAMPPLLGWTAVTGHMSMEAWLLVLIIFVWTPPHFWALAIFRHVEYADAKIPMLPVTHGLTVTRNSVLAYTVALLVISLLPYFIKMSGVLYLVCALLLGCIFLYYALRLKISTDIRWGMRTFRYSIVYLFLLFVAMFIDHYLR